MPAAGSTNLSQGSTEVGPPLQEESMFHTIAGKLYKSAVSSVRMRTLSTIALLSRSDGPPFYGFVLRYLTLFFFDIYVMYVRCDGKLA